MTTETERIGTPREDCDHPFRYRTIGGWEACETCAELDAGWKQCGYFGGCRVLIPPTEERCEAHTSPGCVTCPDCKGKGDVDCDEIDCHGENCEDGITSCETCLGRGEVEKPEVAS